MGEVLADWEATLFQITFWIINALITITSFLFVLSFCRLREKSIGMYMILILTLSDFSFPLMNMFTTLVEINKKWDNVLYIIAVILFCFSLYWSTVIAVFSYEILAVKKAFDSERFFKKAVLTCAILCFFCPCMIIFNIFGVNIKSLGPGFSTVGFPLVTNKLDQYLGWFFFDIVGMFSPTFVIYYCYNEVYKALKVSYDGVIEYAELSSSRVFIYVLIPTLCFLPWILVDLYTIYTEIEMSFSIILLACIFRRAWGFLNLLAYWILSPGYTGGRYSDTASEAGLEDTLQRTESL